MGSNCSKSFSVQTPNVPKSFPAIRRSDTRTNHRLISLFFLFLRASLPAEAAAARDCRRAPDRLPPRITCLRVPEEEIVPVETIDLQKDLRYQEVPVKILDTVTKRTRSSEVRSRRSYVGTRRCIKEGISPSVQNSVESRG